MEVESQDNHAEEQLEGVEEEEEVGACRKFLIFLKQDKCFFLDIEALQDQGIGAADITKLRQAGICTVRVI